MNSSGFDMGFAALMSIHFLAAFAFLIGTALIIGWAVKTLPAEKLKTYALWLLIGGGLVCILTLGARGSMGVTGGMRGEPGMKMMNMQKMDHMMDDDEDGMGMQDAMDMSMKDMADMLKGKTGDDFDAAFLEGMIPHHQGAIDMARAAQTSAKHAEVKNMANAIISAQQNEIDMMKQWQTNWGYTQ